MPRKTFLILLALAALTLTTLACGGGPGARAAGPAAGDTAPADSDAAAASAEEMTAADEVAMGENLAKATFAGGCFWCMEPPFDKLDGVVSTISGYAGGEKVDPSYDQVSSGGTGHAEVIQITYDPEKVTYEQLLGVFWKNVDPTDAGGQFCDRGSQYRTGIFTHDDEQRRLAEAARRELKESGRIAQPIVTEITPLDAFYPAEAYHQNFYKTNPDRYYSYRRGCRRDQRLKELWG